MKRFQPHHDLLIIADTRFKGGDIGFNIADIAFYQLNQSQGLLLVLHAFAQLAAQQNGRSTPEDVIAQHQGIVIDATVVIHPNGSKEAPKLQLQLHQRPGNIVGVFLHRSGGVLDLHQAVERAPGKRQDGYIQNDDQWPSSGLSFHPMLLLRAA